MKTILSTAFLFGTMIFFLPVYAGSGHAHDKDGGHSVQGHAHGAISSKKAATKAKHKVAYLAKTGKIDKSWSGLKHVSVEKKKFKKGEEWVITFKNNKVKDKTKQSLYIFYSLDGHYIAANHTGD